MNVLQTEGAVINYPKEGWQNSLVNVYLGRKQDHLGETAMHTTSIVQASSLTLASGITIPDSKMAREVTELVRDTENSLLFHHFEPRLLLFRCNR